MRKVNQRHIEMQRNNSMFAMLYCFMWTTVSAMTLRNISGSQWFLQNISPSFQPVIILDLHKLTLPLSLTRVRRELWHLLLFVNRSWWKHRCRKVGLHDTYWSGCLMVGCRDRWEEQKRLFSRNGNTGHFVCVYLLLPVNPQRGELCNPLSFHCGQPLSLGGVRLWVCSAMISLWHSSVYRSWLISAIW